MSAIDNNEMEGSAAEVKTVFDAVEADPKKLIEFSKTKDEEYRKLREERDEKFAAAAEKARTIDEMKPSKNRLDAAIRLAKYFIVMKALEFADAHLGANEGETGFIANVKEFGTDLLIGKAAHWLFKSELGDKFAGDGGDVGKYLLAQKLLPGQTGGNPATADLISDQLPKLMNEVIFGPGTPQEKEGLFAKMKKDFDRMTGMPGEFVPTGAAA